MKKFIAFIKNLFKEASQDRISLLSAALAYYAIFALAPLLTIILAIASLIFGKTAAKGQLFAQIQNAVGKQVAEMIEQILRQSYHTSGAVLATTISIIVIIFGAIGIFSQLRESFHIIWKTKIPKKEQGILRIAVDNAIAFLLLMVIGLLFIAFMVINTVITAIMQYAHEWVAYPPITIELINGCVSIAVGTLLFAIIYKYLSQAKLTWKNVFLGSLITSLLLSIGKIGLNFYLTNSAISSGYGAAGTIVVLLLWIYYSAHILFLGAELIKMFSRNAEGKLITKGK